MERPRRGKKDPRVVHVTRAAFIKPDAGGRYAVGKGGVETAMAGAVPGEDVEMTIEVAPTDTDPTIHWIQREVDKRTVAGLEGKHDGDATEPIRHLILEQLLQAPEFEDFRRMSILWWWVHHRNAANLHEDASKAGFPQYFDRYNRVSYAIAAKMDSAGLLAQDATVLVHDAYYFARVPQGIDLINRKKKAAGAAPLAARFVGINHIPFPAPKDFAMVETLDIPEFRRIDSGGVPFSRKVVAHYLAGWAGLSAVSFHTQKDADNFAASVATYLGERFPLPQLIVNPLGINVDHVRTIIERAAPGDRQRLTELLGKRGIELDLNTLKDKTVFADIGTRADPIKRIPLKFEGLDMLLQARPELKGKVVLVQQIRQHRQEYASYRDEYATIRRLRDEINQRHRTADWSPIVLVDESLNNSDVLLMYNMLAERAQRFAGCFTGYEGMCLSAQESFVAAQAFSPGLIVTEEAGVGSTLRSRGANTDFIIPQTPTPADVARAMDRMIRAPQGQLVAEAEAIGAIVEDIQLSHWTDRLMGLTEKKDIE